MEIEGIQNPMSFPNERWNFFKGLLKSKKEDFSRFLKVLKAFFMQFW